MLDHHVGRSMAVKAPAKFIYASLTSGDPCPWVRKRSALISSLAVDAFHGRYIVPCFFGSAANPAGRLSECLPQLWHCDPVIDFVGRTVTIVKSRISA